MVLSPALKGRLRIWARPLTSLWWQWPFNKSSNGKSQTSWQSGWAHICLLSWAGLFLKPTDREASVFPQRAVSDLCTGGGGGKFPWYDWLLWCWCEGLKNPWWQSGRRRLHRLDTGSDWQCPADAAALPPTTPYYYSTTITSSPHALSKTPHCNFYSPSHHSAPHHHTVEVVFSPKHHAGNAPEITALHQTHKYTKHRTSSEISILQQQKHLILSKLTTVYEH